MIIFALLQGLGRPKHSWSILWLWLKKAATIPAFGSKLNPCCTSRSFQSTIVPRFLHEGVKKLGSHHVDQNIYKPQLLSSECRDTKSTFFNHQNVNLTPIPSALPSRNIVQKILSKALPRWQNHQPQITILAWLLNRVDRKKTASFLPKTTYINHFRADFAGFVRVYLILWCPHSTLEALSKAVAVIFVCSKDSEVMLMLISWFQTFPWAQHTAGIDSLALVCMPDPMHLVKARLPPLFARHLRFLVSWDRRQGVSQE